MSKHLTIISKFFLFSIALLVIIIDQFTKHLALSKLQLLTPKIITPFWSWILTYNSGAAFSFLANQNGWQRMFFISIASIIIIILICYLLAAKYYLLSGIAFNFILGGAISNLIDRLVLGKVIDFIDLHYLVYHWPTFNIADSFITCGIVLLIIDSLWSKK
jgi:signal peptidase II